MEKIALEISKAIKQGKWLNIEYDGLEGRTYFWIAIKDIDPLNRIIYADIFNEAKSLDVLENRKLYFDKIVNAYAILGTTYPLANDLIKKITSNYSQYDFLEFLSINERIFSYYLDCYNNDKETGIKDYALINGLDLDVIKNPSFKLSYENFEKAVKELKNQIKLDKQKEKQEKIKLALNILSINKKNVLYPIVYKEVLLNIKEKKFELAPNYSFNTEIIDKYGNKKNLGQYLDYNYQIFVDNYASDPKRYTEDIVTNLSKDEVLDEMPYFYKLSKFIGININNEYKQIYKQFKNQELAPPLKAFFGILEKEKKRKPKSILVNSNSINEDQYRAIVNAMNKDIVYVQGPPGTGKSITIVNIILSCLLNKQTCLITSNNNEAIDNIYRKLNKFRYQNQIIDLPVLRLGSNENIAYTLDRMLDIYKRYQELKIDDVKTIIEVLEEQFKQQLEPLNELINNYEESLEQNEQIESLNNIIQQIQANDETDEISKALTIAGIKAQIQNLRTTAQSLEITHDQVHLDLYLVNQYLFYKSYQSFKKLFVKSNLNLQTIIKIDDKKERLLQFNKYIKKSENLKKLLEIFPLIISTNLGTPKLGECKPHFDLLVMDEASQSNNAISLLALARAKRLVLVGDQNQLQPVVILNTLKNEELMQTYDIPKAYDYKNNSILSTMLSIDTVSKFILLRNHYRCHPLIIGFSNQKYYDNELILPKVKSDIDTLKLINVDSYPNNEKNCSLEEVEAIIKEIESSKEKDIAVITPFKKQALLIKQKLADNHLDHVKVGTIHTFQGDEKEKIIISSGISKNTKESTFNWVKNNQELINVATTRAKNSLVLVTDVQQIEKLSSENNDFYELLNYIKEKGQYFINYHENELFTSKVKNYKYYNTKTEEQFLKVLMHLKSIYRKVIIETKVKVTDVLTLDHKEKELFTYGNQAHFDFVMYNLEKKPLLVIELVGNEHFNDEKVKIRDEKKKAICHKHNIMIITIKNDYVRRYLFIKETIIEVLKDG